MNEIKRLEELLSKAKTEEERQNISDAIEACYSFLGFD